MKEYNIENIVNSLKIDEEAHSRGTCSYNVLALCSAEEQKLKAWLKENLAIIIDRNRMREGGRARLMVAVEKELKKRITLQAQSIKANIVQFLISQDKE